MPLMVTADEQPGTPWQQQLQSTFAAELNDRLRVLEQLLARLGLDNRADARSDLLDSLFREAHNLRGAAWAAEAATVERAAHALESAVEQAGRKRGVGSRPWLGALRRAVDRLHAVAVAFKEPEPGSDSGPRQSARPWSGAAQERPPAGETIRVAAGEVDVLLELAGKLVAVQQRVEQRAGELQWVARGLRARRAGSAGQALPDNPAAPLASVAERLAHELAQLGGLARALQAEVAAIRLQPAAAVFDPFVWLVRDLARATGKEAELQVEGGETVVDRQILDRLRDPVNHLLRNAIDHGIEPPHVRLAHGKPRVGRIRLSVTRTPTTVEVALEDDGVGIDPALVRASAVARGLLSLQEAAALDERAAIELIFESGLTTRFDVTDMSGRGVGMDVVRHQIQQLSGEIQTHSLLGQGTRFLMRVPDSLPPARVAGQGHPPVTGVPRRARTRTQPSHRHVA